MTILFTILVTFFAGMGAGLGTGFAGMSAAAVITPMLITFLDMDPYMAVGIALSSDVLASAVSAYTYGKNKNLDVRNGLIMMASVLAFTVVGSYIASLVPSATMGGFSVFMTFLLGIKFILRPVMTTKETMMAVSARKRAIQSVVCGMVIGFICGFVGAGGGMMMLLILTSVLGYELKTAVGTSVFIMTFTALTGAVIGIGAGKAELVVARALFGVAEHLVGLVELLKALFGGFVVGMQVGVALLGLLAVRAFDFGLGGILAYAQHLIIIALCQKAHLLTFKTCCIYRPNAPARVREEVPPPRRG